MYQCRSVIVTTILVFIITITVDASSSSAHQRFSSLNRLLNRLDVSTEIPSTSAVPTTLAPHRIRHAHWQHNFDNTFEQFETLSMNNNDSNPNNNNNYNKNNNNNNKNKEQSSLQPLFDEDDEEDEDEDIDEPQEQLQSDIRHRLPFTTSIGKSEWNPKSHRKSYEKLYNSYRFPMSAVKMTGGEQDPKAYEEYHLHHLRMRDETKCKTPQPKVVRVSDYYPSGTKTYQPSCIRLHKCDEDTGCCDGNRRCGVKTSQKVEMYFHVGIDVPYYMGSRQYRTASRIEKLQFYNHTECECHDRNDEMPRDTVEHKLQNAQENNHNRCKCPSEYTVRNLANGSCSCDCFDKQRDCTKYKKGKEYFNHQDRLCIEMRTCTVPACDFGVYIRRSGRCPKKYEKYRTWPRYKP